MPRSRLLRAVIPTPRQRRAVNRLERRSVTYSTAATTTAVVTQPHSPPEEDCGNDWGSQKDVGDDHSRSVPMHGRRIERLLATLSLLARMSHDHKASFHTPPHRSSSRAEHERDKDPGYLLCAPRYAAITHAGTLPRSVTVRPFSRPQERTSALLGKTIGPRNAASPRIACIACSGCPLVRRSSPWRPASAPRLEASTARVTTPRDSPQVRLAVLARGSPWGAPRA
jgi:hypothetical protein